jgi:hypothetical protein
MVLIIISSSSSSSGGGGIIVMHSKLKDVILSNIQEATVLVTCHALRIIFGLQIQLLSLAKCLTIHLRVL